MRTLLTLLCFLLVTSVAAAQEETRSATNFAKSLCFNTHSNYPPPHYEHERVVQALNDIGPGLTIREGYHGREDQEGFYQLAYDRGGHRQILILDPRNDRPLQELMEHIEEDKVPGIYAVEGPNEWNTVGPFREYDGSPPRQFMIDGANFVRQIVALRDSMELNVKVADLTLTNWQASYEYRDAIQASGGDLGVDYGNIHYYTPGVTMAPGFVNGWNDPLNWVREHFVFVQHGPTKPWWTTEIGYHTSLLDPGPDVEPTRGHHGVPESVQAYYQLVTWLESSWYQFHTTKKPLTCFYELLDMSCPLCGGQDHHQNNFGIYRADFSPKPARDRLKNARLATLRPGKNHTPVTWTYELTGPNNDPGWYYYRWFSMRRGDGRKVLAVWRPDSIWDTQTYTVLNPPDYETTLRFDGTQDVDIFNPKVSSRPVRTCRATGSVTWQQPADDATFVVVGKTRSRNPGAC